MGRHLTRQEIRLAARFLVEFMELQARGAPESELEAWRSRVAKTFPGERREEFVVTVRELLEAKGTDLRRILGVAA